MKLAEIYSGKTPARTGKILCVGTWASGSKNDLLRTYAVAQGFEYFTDMSGHVWLTKGGEEWITADYETKGDIVTVHEMK